MKYLLRWLYEKYQHFQGFLLLALLIFFIILSILGTMFIYHFKTIMRCIGLACLMLLLTPLPACQALKQGEPQNYLLEVAKSITKSNLQKLFSDAHFEKDSISASKVVSQEFLRKVFHEKVRHFLTSKGNITAQTQDFYADISWERTGEQVRISLIYHKRSKQDLQGSRLLPTKRPRDGLRSGRVSCTSCLS